MRLRRSRFVDLVARQLDLFATDEEHGLLAEVRQLQEQYDRAGRGDAEEAYGDYADAVEAVTEALAEVRDGYARTLDGGIAAEYEAAFNDAVRKRWPPFGLEIENR